MFFDFEEIPLGMHTNYCTLTLITRNVNQIAMGCDRIAKVN
jgi:hypothetical protein